MKIKKTDVKNLIVMKRFWKNSKTKQTTHIGKIIFPFMKIKYQKVVNALKMEKVEKF